MSWKIETLHEWDTEFSADSVEWCPSGPHQNIFACGTYQLAPSSTEAEAPAKRLGRLYLFSVTSTNGLSLLHQIEMPAILDSKWCHVKLDGKIILAVANAIGEVLLYELIDCKLCALSKYVVGKDETETLALSLDWSTARTADESLLTVSDSRGNITVVAWSEGSLSELHSWHAHDFEAWITAFDYWNTSIVFTGGDDCKMKVYDRRNSFDSPVLTSKLHEAGVTSMHCNPGREHVFASGSYDEKLRLWDTRSMKHAVTTTTLSGGVWRLKWDPNDNDNLLAACMHGGFRVVRTAESVPGVVASYDEHESLAYGSDWCHSTDVGRIVPTDVAARCDVDAMAVIATCSFYDHMLRVSVCNKTN